MAQSGPEELRELIGADVPADELERLARVDAFLRVAAAAAPLERRLPGGPGLSLVAAEPRATGRRPQRALQQTHELKLTFSELALVYKALQAAKAHGALRWQDELLNDTIQVVDQALSNAI